MEKSQLSKRGFTLVEVMVALSIFSFFIAAFVTNQGYNLSDSAEFKEDLILRNYADAKINEIITSPPVFNLSLTLTKDVGKFEDNGDYSYSVSFKEFKLPDLAKIQGAEDEKDISALEKKIFENIEKNLKVLIWQVEVTVESKLSEKSLTLSTLLYHQKGKVELNAF